MLAKLVFILLLSPLAFFQSCETTQKDPLLQSAYDSKPWNKPQPGEGASLFGLGQSR